MKRVISVLIALVFLSACAPSPQAIQTAIAKTQAAWTPTHTVTLTPSPTSTLTSIPLPPTHTSLPLPPTSTPVPKTTYIMETGWCIPSVGDVSGRDPKKVQPGCIIEARQQVQLGPNENIEPTLDNNNGNIEVYCALFSLDGTFIMSDVDAIGSGKVTCHP